MIQDVPTRWWSTDAMIERFLDLLPYLNLLVTQKSLHKDSMLSREEENELRELHELLEPFMLAQKVLEGQKYVTISLVPYLINEIRQNLIKVKTGGKSIGVRKIAEQMLHDSTKGFEVKFPIKPHVFAYLLPTGQQ